MKGYISEDTIEKVRDSADIVNIITDYVPLKKTGANHVGLCPFHNEKTPSFTVSDSKQIFHCFGCGEGGDVVTFIMKKENLDFPEAVIFLADKLGIAVEEIDLKQNSLDKDKSKGYEINRDAARFFYSNLWKQKIPLNYLKNRSIPDKVIKQFGLGYSLDSWNSLYNHLKSKGYKDEEIEKVGLIGKRSNGNGYYDKFRNRIMFPIINTKGNILGFGGRVLDESMPKYLNSQETYIFNKGNNLYGLNLLNKFSDKKKIILVEGYMDVISLYSKGITYSVASLGTALTERQAKLIKRYGKEVYISYDSDNAGIKATEKAVNILKNQDVEPNIIVLDNYKDPDDFLKEKGIKAFEKKIKEAYKYIDYRIYISKDKYNTNEVEGKIKFTVEISKDIKRLKSPIEKDVYIDKISKEMNISREAIEKEVFGNTTKRDIYKKNDFNEKKEIYPQKTVLLSGDFIAEMDLIKLILYDKDFYDIISREIFLDEFNNKECSEIFRIANILYEKDETIDKFIVREKLKEVENVDMNLVNKILNSKMEFLPENIDQIIEDLIYKKKISRLEFRRNTVKKLIKDLETKKNKSPQEEDKFLKLCVELTDLNKKLNLNRSEDGR